ncbi:MAG: hypothetical protein WCM76_03250 [Bacteroidota bacterium]
MESKKCPQCGKEFEGRANRIYCSLNCKMNAFKGLERENENRYGFTETVSENGSEPNKMVFPVKTDSSPVKNNNLQNCDITVSPKKTDNPLETVLVSISKKEKEYLEDQANACGSSLSQFIRIRSQMDETDVFELENTISEQKKELDELKIKLSFYSTREIHEGKTDSGVYDSFHFNLNKNQTDFIRKKYLESWDFDDTGMETALPGGHKTNNEAQAILADERKQPGALDEHIEFWMLFHLMDSIEQRLKKYCGYSEEDFEDESLIDQLDDIR